MEEQLPSEQHWTLDQSLQRYFLFAAMISIACLLVGIILNIFSLDEGAIPLPLRIAINFVGVGSAVSALFLWISMWSYWWQVDRKKHGMNALWLVALSLGNWAGATIYYFFVFRKITQGASLKRI
jgi:hypothetical protein